MMFVVILIIVFSLFILIEKKFFNCGDGTLQDSCSLRKPYFCFEGSLIEKASICGCPENLNRERDFCFSDYQTIPKKISLSYVLRGNENKINFFVYGGLMDHLLTVSKSIYYDENKVPLRVDFKLKKINEIEQKFLLLPLVTQIQNIAPNRDDQVRIAISLVQNIPYEESSNFVVFRGKKINVSRTAYEVLYDMKGACEGRSELLSFLLKELGYGVVIFYYPLENHEAVGIKCPLEYSLDNTGYCFIETTGVSILSNSEGDYFGWGKLSFNPEVLLISEGDSLGKNLYEYGDAKDFIFIENLIKKKGKLNYFQYQRLKSLNQKYGIDV